MVFVFDTDVLSIWHSRRQPAYDRVRQHVEEHRTDEIATSIISFQEHVQGWMSLLHKAKGPEKLLRAYEELRFLLINYSALRVFSFDQKALTCSDNIRRQRVRLGTLDLRIASIALAHRATVVTRNVRDFAKVPGLSVEDWTR